MILLLNQYKNAREELNGMIKKLGNSEWDKEDEKLINSMIESTSKIIEWIETGKNPYFEQGIDVNNAYHIQYLSNMDLLPDITEQLPTEREPLELTDKQKRIIIKLFKVLSDRERDCFILHVANEMSMSEVADKLGISKSSVQEYVKRARGKIKELL